MSLGKWPWGLVWASTDSYVEPLYSSSSLTVARAALGLAYGWLFIAWTASLRTGSVPRLDDIAAPMALLMAAGLALLVARIDVAGGNATLVAGATAVLYLWPASERSVLAAAVVCLAGLLLSRGAAVLAALCLSLLPGLGVGSLLALWLSVAVLWVSSNWIYAALGQVAERQARAVRLEREVLARRGELRRVNDSLRTAYALLTRTNRELAQARDEAEEAQRLKAQFAATISHELRTPLNLILGFSEVMYKTPESYAGATLTADLRGDIREIYRATAHLLDLVDDILDLSRVEQVRLALTPEETDVLALVRDAAETVTGLFRGKPVRLRVDLPTWLPQCTVDRTRIRQVLVNLLANAARHTDEGEVCVRAFWDEAHGEVVVGVTDSGDGIPEDERARLFDAFYQVANPANRARGGSGLGLAICKTFVQLHCGRIWVESEVGKGSRFAFTIPVRGPARRAVAEAKRSAVSAPFAESIVAVDSGGRAARWLERAIPTFRVHTVASAAEARAVAAKWHPKTVVVFAGGDDSASLTQTLAELTWPGLPLVSCRLLDGRPLKQYPNIRAVLTKPVATDALLQAIDDLGPLHSLLLADDDTGMTRLVLRTLGRSRPGIRVLSAHDGNQALAILRRERPDAVLLDLAMPELDGLAVLEAMSGEGLCDVPVTVLTAMDLHGPGGEMATRELVVSSCLGLSGGEVARYVEALAQAAQPRYG